MFSIIIGVVAGLVAGALVSVGFSTWWAGILPALVVFGAVAVFLVLRVNKQVGAAMGGVMGLMQKRDIEGALALMKNIKLRFGNWAPFMKAQIDAQIGAIHFTKGELETSRPYLESAFVRSWDAKLMLAVLKSGALDDVEVKGKKGESMLDLSKAKKLKKKELTLAPVDDEMERTVRFSDKQGLLWSTWAWLHWSNGDTKKALEILSRGKEKLGESDPHLASNLLALQNDKKMKMKGYGQAWYALHLEMSPAEMEQRRGPQMKGFR